MGKANEITEELMDAIRKNHSVEQFTRTSKRNIFIVDNKELIYVCYSKHHTSSGRYWFGIDREFVDKIKEYPTYILFICESIQNYFKIEFNKISSLLSMKQTAEDGYWKIHINTKFELLEGHLDLKLYRDRYGLFGAAGNPPDDDVQIQDEQQTKKDREKLLSMFKEEYSKY